MVLFIYRILINIIFILSPIIVLIRIVKKKEDLKRFKEKFCIFSKKKIKKKIDLVSWSKCWRNFKYNSISF